MVNLTREGLVRLLFSLSRSVFKSEDSTEVPEEPQALASVNAEVEPMKAYWESEKQIFNAKNQPFLDLFSKGAGLERIPDVTEEPTKESHYNYDNFSPYLSEAVKHFNVQGVPETPKTDPGISNNGRDAGVIAGIVVAVISGVIILAALIAVVMYRHYVHRNVTSMNFDNPVYRKTTEDQFALEKNGYAPGSKLYPSTVGEEAQEPLNTPGTNEFV